MCYWLVFLTVDQFLAVEMLSSVHNDFG